MRRFVWIIALIAIALAPGAQAANSLLSKGSWHLSSAAGSSISHFISQLPGKALRGARAPLAHLKPSLLSNAPSVVAMQAAEARVKPVSSKPVEAKKPISLSSAVALLCLSLIILIAAVRVVLARSIHGGKS
jgi:hypothetical protein